MSKKQKLFYFTWTVAWVGLALCTSVLFVTLSGGPKTLFDGEAWFVTFPVGWTVALLVVRYQDSLKDFFTHPFIKPLYILPMWSWFAWSFWERGVRKEHVGYKMMGVMFALLITGLFVALIAGALQALKSNAKSPKP